ncbi:ABC transporter ATP-binding protein [Bacteriovoracaceae bacterium]|nr:ABC transporter ATP-binding protein [Bacteriovoracaceae bacterium]
MNQSVIEISKLNKIYEGGFRALDDVNLNINQGEIFALLGPNGAGKTTLISIICGINRFEHGEIKVGGFDIKKDYRKARSQIGLVPQELTRDAFETVWNTVSFSRGLFGKKRDDAKIEKILKDLSLWEKKDNKLMTLSGGMKRRVMIAKALSHEPQILFLDEPTAGVDVELRKSMWNQVRQLRESGVTIILTTHYIEEAEEMADRIGIINQGKIIHTDRKSELMSRLGQKELTITLENTLETLPSFLAPYKDLLKIEGENLVYKFDSNNSDHSIENILKLIHQNNLGYVDLNTKQSSLEEIFVNLVSAS